MAKYQSGFYIQIPRRIFQDYRLLSPQACRLYLWLKELEHRYCGKEHSFFFHTDVEIAFELNVSVSWVARARKELVEKNIICFTRKHFLCDGKLSEKRVGCYSFPNEEE